MVNTNYYATMLQSWWRQKRSEILYFSILTTIKLNYEKSVQCLSTNPVCILGTENGRDVGRSDQISMCLVCDLCHRDIIDTTRYSNRVEDFDYCIACITYIRLQHPLVCTILHPDNPSYCTYSTLPTATLHYEDSESDTENDLISWYNSLRPVDAPPYLGFDQFPQESSL